MILFSTISRRDGVGATFAAGAGVRALNPHPTWTMWSKEAVVGVLAVADDARALPGGGEGDSDRVGVVLCAQSQPAAPQRRIPKSN